MVGFGEFLIAFAVDFEHTLKVIETELVEYTTLSGPLADASRFKLKIMFSSLVQFHCDLRQLCGDYFIFANFS